MRKFSSDSLFEYSTDGKGNRKFIHGGVEVSNRLSK